MGALLAFRLAVGQNLSREPIDSDRYATFPPAERFMRQCLLDVRNILAIYSIATTIFLSC
jgi:hypothetical protein